MRSRNAARESCPKIIRRYSVAYPAQNHSRSSRSTFVTLCLLAAAVLGAHPALAADTDPGAAQFLKSCGTCHTVDPKAPPRQGPNLHKVVGRPAGTMKGFKYSPAFVKAAPGITWTADMIDKWITDPQHVIPGAVMLYHQSDPDKR